MKFNKLVLSAAVSAVTLSATQNVFAAENITEALTTGKAYGDFRLRYETVSQDNTVDDATALTLRTRLGYNTAAVNGFSATVEFEDSRIVAAQGDYTVGPTGYNVGDYSVIADPETTELDQMFVQYKNDVVTAKVGRQVLTLDNHRFVGHVGWRQDRQTFDGISTKISATENFTITAAYLAQRNRIFGEVADIDSEDFLLNLAYKTPVGTIKAYSYNLAVEDVDNSENDTVGLSFGGKTGAFIYHAEYAAQETANNEADYYNLVLGGVAGPVTIKGGYEVLGSDNGMYGFSTPLATLHKFNGWADIFLGTPGTGLEDLSLTVSAKAGPGKFVASYHTYSANDGDMDYGSEIDLLYAMKFGKNYNAGVKLASYSADDLGVDTDKLWLWLGASF